MDERLQAFMMRTNHGKNMVEASNSSWFVLDTSGESFDVLLREVRIGNDGSASFDRHIVFASPSEAGVLRTHGKVTSSAIGFDRQGFLYAALSDEHGTFVARSRAGGIRQLSDVSSSDKWTVLDKGSLNKPVIPDNSVLGDLIFDVDGSPVLPYICKSQTSEIYDRVCLACWQRNWKTRQISTGQGLFPPTGTIGPDGNLHLVWSDVYERIFYSCISMTDSGNDPDVRIICKWGRQPVVSVADDKKVIIAFEPEQSHTICYAVIENGDIRVFGDDDRVLTQSEKDARFSRELFHSPQFTQDRNGTLWLFFVNAIRRNVYACKWLGNEWSALFDVAGIRTAPVRGDYRYVPVERFSVPKSAKTLSDSAIGIYLESEKPAVGQSFEVLKSVDKIDISKKILFLDMLEVYSMTGLQVVPGKADKVENNPLLEPCNNKAFDCTHVFNSGTVLKGKDSYNMWYSGVGDSDPSVEWWNSYEVGFAQSKDGLNWSRVNLGFCDAPNENMIPDMPSVPAIFYDKQEPDPDKRYKMLQFYIHSLAHELALKGMFYPGDGCYHGNLFTSPDGLNWQKTPLQVACPSGMHLELIPQSFFRDTSETDPGRLFKAYGWMSMTQGQRGVGMAYSPDAINWTAYEKNPVLAPELRGYPFVPAGPYSHIHDCVVFPYAGYYLALYQYLYEPLTADIELAVSRDGYNFKFVNCGSKIIEHGSVGDWDSGTIVPSVPVIEKNGILLYYGATDHNYLSNDFNEDLNRTRFGLAKMRIDGFAYLTLKDGFDEGFFQSIPLEIPQGKFNLTMNADASNAQIHVELVDTITGSVVPGFSFDECIAVESNDEKINIQWLNSSSLPECENTLSIRVRLKRQSDCPRLYSLGFKGLDCF
jgi:hypothetical protein